MCPLKELSPVRRHVFAEKAVVRSQTVNHLASGFDHLFIGQHELHLNDVAGDEGALRGQKHSALADLADFLEMVPPAIADNGRGIHFEAFKTPFTRLNTRGTADGTADGRWT